MVNLEIGCVFKQESSKLWHLLPDLLDMLLDVSLRSRAPPKILNRQPEPEVLVAVLLLHVGEELL